jgi:stage V sporulation protein D (sporulation-specific penicillin-binding protein)
MMHIGKLLGAKKFVQYQERFGFGTKTGIDLPNELINTLIIGKLPF